MNEELLRALMMQIQLQSIMANSGLRQPIGRENISMPGLDYSRGDVVVPTDYPNPELTTFGIPQVGAPIYRGAGPPTPSYPVSPYTDPTIYGHQLGSGLIGNANRNPIQEEGPDQPRPIWGNPPINEGVARPPNPQFRGPTNYEALPSAPPMGLRQTGGMGADPITQLMLQMQMQHLMGGRRL